MAHNLVTVYSRHGCHLCDAAVECLETMTIELEFEIEIKYMLIAEQWILEKEPSLTLKNPELPGGIYYIYGGRYDMCELRDMVKKKNCADMDPKIEDVEKKLESICRNISLSTYRDTKIDKII